MKDDEKNRRNMKVGFRLEKKRKKRNDTKKDKKIC